MTQYSVFFFLACDVAQAARTGHTAPETFPFVPMSSLHRITSNVLSHLFSHPTGNDGHSPQPSGRGAEHGLERDSPCHGVLKKKREKKKRLHSDKKKQQQQKTGRNVSLSLAAAM